MANLLTDEKIIEIYHAIDRDNNGTIDADEFTDAFVKLFPTIQVKTLQKLFKYADKDGKFDQQSFIDLVRFLERKKDKNNPYVMLFDFCDSNGNGVLEKDEFIEICRVIEENASIEVITKCFDDADLDHNGVIDFKEYMLAIDNIVEKLLEI